MSIPSPATFAARPKSRIIQPQNPLARMTPWDQDTDAIHVSLGTTNKYLTYAEAVELSEQLIDSLNAYEAKHPEATS